MSVLKLTKNDIIRNDDKEEKIKLKRSDLSYDSARVSGWEQANRQSLDILNDYNNRINKSEWLTKEDRENYKKALDSYIETSNYLRGINKTFGEGYTDEDEKNWNDSIASMNTGFDEISNFYSQFASDKEYDLWHESFKSDEEYAQYSKDIDLEKASQGWQKFLVDDEAEKQAALYGKEDEKWWETLGRYLGSGGAVDTTLPMGTTTQVVHDLRADQSHRRPSEDWSDEQRNVFGNLYLESPELAFIYAEETNKRNNKAKEQAGIEKIQDAATSGFWAGFGNTLGAIATSPLGLADYLQDLAMANAGRDIASDGNISPFEYSQAVQGGITTHLNDKYGVLDENIPVFGGAGLGDLYGLGTSIGQSMLSAYTLGGAGTLVSYFGQGAAAGMEDALSRGASEGQAAIYGAALGAFEGVAEKIGIDNLFKLGSSSTVKGLLKNILKQAGAEGGEEMLTAIMGNIADALIMQDKSNFAYQIAEYMNDGLSESEAKWKVFRKSLEGIAYDTIAGALSGAVSGGIHSGVQTAFSNADAKANYSDEIEDILVDAGTNGNLSKSDKKYVDEYIDKYGKNGKLSGWNINHLLEITDNAKVTSAVETRLTKLGETGDVSQLAEVITKYVQGMELSKKEQKMLDNSTFGKRVINELDPRNIESGMYDTRWAETIGTRRLNSLEYNNPQLIREERNRSLTEEQESNPEVLENTPVDSNATELDKVNTDTPTVTSVTEGENGTRENIESSDASIETEEENAVTLEDASAKYGAQAQAMVHTYVEGQDVAQYDKAYQAAYDMGKSGVAFSYVANSESASYLTEKQRELAYEAGKAASDTAAKAQYDKIKSAANGKTGRRKGTVKGEGVTIADLKKTFNDTQNKAYKILSTASEVTGIDIVLYKSEANADGNFEGAQGKFNWADDKIYIDINAGLANIKSVDDLAKYSMIRTFSHEFTHFIEKYNPILYNEFRKVVFDTLTARGENVNDLIEAKLSMDRSGKMTYEKASREVVAEAMTDILPDSKFVETLATEHKNIFEKLLEKLKEFLADIKAYFNTLGHNRSREANALKEQVGDTVRYVEDIVKLFDKVAVEAVENYQLTVAFEEKAENIVTTETKKAENIATKAENKAKAEKTLFEKYNEVKQKYPNNIVLYRVGDFFEVLGEDAKAVAEWTDATLTGRNDPNAGRVDMVGFPFHMLDRFVEKIRTHQGVTLVQDENGTVKEYPKAQLESSKPKATVSETENVTEHRTPEATQEKASETLTKSEEELTIEEREKAYKKKFSQWLKKPGRKYVLNYGGVSLLSNGAFGMRATKDEIGWAKLEFSGTMEEIDLPKHIADMLDNATTPVTEAPLEGGVGNDSVYVFNVDGKQMVYNKKLLSRLDGNLFYMGDYSGGVKILKAVDADGNIEGFLLPLRLNTEVTNTKPSKLKSFSKKTQPSIKDTENNIEVAPKKETNPEAKKGFAFFDNLQEGNIASSESFAVNGIVITLQKNTKSINGVLTKYVVSTKMGDGEVTWRHPEYFSSFDEAKSYASTLCYDAGEYSHTNETENVKEAKPNVENVDNRATVQQPVGNRKGNPQVLEGLQTADVSGDAQRGDSVGDSVERGQQTVRNDVQPDAAGTRRGPSEGDSQVGDLRGDDELTSEAKEKLHEEVSTQIEQQSTEKPKGKNFVIGDTLDLPNGEKTRYKANIEAIRLVKQLESEGRYATEAEQAILSKYVGWGGLANAFDERKADWSKEFKELQELLTKEEYELARGSTLNAHYTDIPVIKAMYDGLSKLGFNGGRMMEPSSGVGNFVGAMPAEMSAKVKSWTMVELDGITGLIAKYLYPNADVRIQGFEKANIPNNYMDVIISNVPFGNYPITDKAYPKKVTSAIHNYFFAKSLDKVRPGGIVMFITSSYTMNSKDETVRRYIMQRADLLGAIRLPDSAFKGNAGTEVVTDILVLKKRDANTAYAGENFLESPYKYVNGYNGANINTYFEAHPEMVLGTASMDGGMYRGNNLTYKALEGKGSLADQIREAFSHIKGKMDYPAQLSPEKTNFAVERAGKKTKQDGYVAKDGKIYQNKDGELIEQTVTSKVAERIKGMLEIRDAAKELQNYQQQGLSEYEIKKARTKLNKVYDAFVKKNGFLNSPSNKNAFKGDPDCFSLFALENWDNDKKTATKSDIFTKNTIAPNRTVTAAKDVSEGLIVSVNQTGGVDVSLIAKLTGKTEASVNRELIDSRKVFKNRDGVLETAETYLSGNVRAKLRDAEALVPMDSDYQKNVEALKAVMPEDVSYQDIFVNPGTPWIPSSVYSDFAAYMLGGRNTEWRQDIDVTRNPETGNFTVELKNSYLKFNSSNTQKWGTSRRTFLDLFDAMLNSKSVVIKDKLDDGSFVINKDATAAANEKIENITKEFQEWLWSDEARRTELATLYNEVFNSIVTPKYNGDNLTVNGANANKPLRPHQRNAVQRIISSGGNTLLAHKVGAGKTYEMAAAAMKLKQLGLVKKPMFAVPKSLVAQWGTEFIDFFPTAKLLVAEAADFTAANRKVFMNRVSNGDYDAVIVSYEQFEKLPVSDDFTRELYQEQINSVIAAIEEAKAEKGGKSLSVKDLEKKRKSLQAKIDKLTDKAKDEGNIDFEQLGVDSLFIDEAHNFKNLFYTTSMTNVSGLGNKDGSKRAFDLYTKVRYLQKLNGGKGIVFATATPVMNSMSEMYIMQKYLQPDLLEQLGLNTFDAWAKQFGEVVNGVEIKPSGQGYRVKQSFSRFKNMSELQLLFRNFADVLTDIPGLKIPKMKGGAVNVVVCEPGQFQKDFMKELEKRADNIKNVDPSVDNMLKITSDGRKISYTQRMIDASLPYEEGCKIYRCADNVVKAYNDSKAIKGTQIVFLDMATPKGKSNTETAETDDDSMDMENARLYDDLKARLIKNGIPAKEIAFIHEADTDQKKKKLFADVNEGTVRVLIGSTGKMGVGMNAQKRIVAIHHLDAPWRPGDVEQRNGRAYRQGNINAEVENFTYVTEGSFDARLWDILERKQNFINQVMNGESVGRETEDTGEVTLSAAEVKALASGSPLILEQVQLDTDIKKLESLYRAHLSAVRAARERLVTDKGQIELLERMIDLGKSDMLSIKDTYSEGKFSITVGKQKFTEKKDAGVALMAEATAKAVDSGYTTIGSFAGFDVRVIKTHEGIKGLIAGKQGYSFNTYPNNTTFMINHMVSVVEGITEKVNLWASTLEETKKDMAEQEKLINEPFAKQAELDEKRKRYNEVMEILNPKEEQSLDSVEEDTVQEQSRDYLSDYTDEDYNNFGWVRVNDVVSEGYWDNFTRNYAEAVYNKRFDRITSDGEYMIEIYDQNLEERLQVIDHIVFAKGSIKSPNVTKILQIYEYDETKLNKYRRNVYDFGRRGIQPEIGELFELHRKADFAAYDKESDSREISRYSKQLGTERGASSSKTSRVKEYVFDNDDEQYQQRTDTLTDREVLEMASNEVKVSDLSQAEKDALTIFQDRLSNLKDLQEKRAEQGRLYKEQQFGVKPNRVEAEKTLNRMRTLDEQIKKATADILTVEEKEVLKRVLKKARKVVEVQERQHGQEILQRWRDRRNNAAAIKKYRDRLRGDVDELTNWIISPDNKDIAKHVPDVLKNSVIPFLSSINFMSKRSLKGGDATVSDKEFIKRLDALKSAIKINIDVYGMYSGYNDLPPDFMESLENFRKSAQSLVEKSEGEFIINQMTSAELKELSKVVSTLKKYIMQINRFHNNAMYQHVYEAGDNSIDFLKELDNAGSHTGSLSNAVFWQQIRPAYAFERFGEGGKAIYDGLRQGQAKLAFNTKEIERFSKSAYTEKEVKAWENEIKTFSLGRDLVKIPVAHLMSFYELSKDPEAKVHIDEGGIRVATYTHKGKKISDVGHILTVGEFNQIISSLTDRQKEVADNLQKYMAQQGAKWGNYVSVARFGEELFTNPKYFPINSDGRHLSATVDEHPSAAALYALLNMSFTKSRKEGANNRIVLYSIFDVFANHMASMAQYNAMALPILDALKWFNYQQVFIDDEGNKTVIASTREQMSRVYGVPDETKPGSGKQGYAETFIVNIIKAFNGTAAQGTPYDSLGLKSMHRYNVAQVAYNLRVVIQQPLAITRAGMLIDYTSILKGLKLSPSAIKKNIEEMQKYSGIAAWKSLGFYDVNISRGLTHLIKHDSNVLDKIGDVGMWGAEKVDNLTWAAMWSACKEEVIKKQHLTPESEGFYEAVTKLFEDVIYKTQVVDSILTKNEFMRDKGTFARLVGSFMSEPTTTASMVIDAVDKYHLDIKRGMNKAQAWQKNGKHIGRVIYVYGIGAVLLAAVQAVADGLRDDDEYEEYGEKWLEAFAGNLVDELMPFNKLPILSDFYDLAKSIVSVFGVDTYGNPPQSVFMQWYDSLVKGIDIIHDKISGEHTNYTWYSGIYKLLQALSGMSGLPMASATREIIAAWNNTIGAMAPSLKVITYEATQTEIRNALYEAMLKGDEKEIERIKGEYEDEKAVDAALRKALREHDPRIKEAAEAVINGKGADYARIVSELVDEGKFSRKIITGAIAAEVEKMRNADN